MNISGYKSALYLLLNHILIYISSQLSVRINPILNTRINRLWTSLPLSRSGYPPWILKRGGLESSGQNGSSQYWKINRIVKLPKISTNSVKSPLGKKRLGLGRSPPQELEVSLNSGLYLLVWVKTDKNCWQSKIRVVI